MSERGYVFSVLGVWLTVFCIVFFAACGLVNADHKDKDEDQVNGNPSHVEEELLYKVEQVNFNRHTCYVLTTKDGTVVTMDCLDR